VYRSRKAPPDFRDSKTFMVLASGPPKDFRRHLHWTFSNSNQHKNSRFVVYEAKARRQQYRPTIRVFEQRND